MEQYVRNDRKCAYEWASWQAEGIQIVNDILNANGDFLSHNEFSESLALDATFYRLYKSDKVCHWVATGDTDKVLTKACEGSFYSF